MDLNSLINQLTSTDSCGNSAIKNAANLSHLVGGSSNILLWVLVFIILCCGCGRGHGYSGCGYGGYSGCGYGGYGGYGGCGYGGRGYDGCYSGYCCKPRKRRKHRRRRHRKHCKEYYGYYRCNPYYGCSGYSNCSWIIFIIVILLVLCKNPCKSGCSNILNLDNKDKC